MKRFSRLFWLLSAAVVLTSTMTAQKVGSTSMQFLKVMPCARATAMGDAYAVIASGAEAVFWNPAGVAYTNGQEFSLTYLKWIFDTQQGALSYALSLGSYGAVGVQLQYVDFGSIDEALWVPPYNQDIWFPGLTGRTFRPYSILVGASYGIQITDRFATGGSVKIAHESLYNGSTVRAVNSKGDTVDAHTWANGLIFDYGLIYNTGFRTVRIGASMQNFGPNVRYAEEHNPIPMSLRVGIAADLVGANALLMESEGNRVGMAAELFQPNDFEQQAHMGVEYEYARTVALRIGYKFNYDADGLTLGFGVHQAVMSANLAFDYSFGSLSYDLGNVHRISLGVGF